MHAATEQKLPRQQLSKTGLWDSPIVLWSFMAMLFPLLFNAWPEIPCFDYEAHQASVCRATFVKIIFTQPTKAHNDLGIR